MILLVHTYPAGSPALSRHQDFFNHSGAERIVAVTTTDGVCQIPTGWEEVQIGRDEYMNGPNLPIRLMDTIRWALDNSESQLITCAEYDTLFLSPVLSMIPPEDPSEPHVWCHLTGGKPFDAQANWFAHNPWIMNRMAAESLLPVMKQIIREGHCEYGKAESSPDVFWGCACERSRVNVHHDVWRQHSRNRFDTPGSLDEAKAKLAEGLDILHGCKTNDELVYIGI